MNQESNNQDTHLQRLLSDVMGPRPVRDDEVERLLDMSPVLTPDAAQLDRIVRRAQRMIRESAVPIGGRLLDRAAPSVATPEQPEMTMRPLNRPSARGSTPRGAVTALIVSAMCLVTVLFWTSRESARQQALSAQHAATREKHISSIQRQWQTARFVPLAKTEPARIGSVISTGVRDRRRVTLPDGSVLFVNEGAEVRIAAARRVEVDRGEIFVEVSPQFDDADRRQKFEVVTPARTVTALGTKFGVDVSDDDMSVVVTQGKIRVSDVSDVVQAGQSVQLSRSKPEGASSSLKRSAAPAITEPRGPQPGRSGFARSGFAGVEPAIRASEQFGWTRDLMTAAGGRLIPVSEHSGGAIISIDSAGQQTKLSLRRYHIDVHIEDGFARTTIDQTYFNHTQQRLEGTFHFPVPPDASLSRLAMYVNGRLMEGGMAEREHARNTFEKIVHKMQDPALLEWVDGSTFKMRVFPLEARQEKRIVLSYTQRLRTGYGRTYYRFPAGHSMDVVSDWSAHLRVKGAMHESWHSPSHELVAAEDKADLILTTQQQNSRMDRDLVVELGRASPELRAGTTVLSGAQNPEERTQARNGARWSRMVHEEDQYLMLRYRPHLPGSTRREPRHWVFLFEASADRNPLLARTQIEIIRTLLDNAEHSDTFNLITAGTEAVAFSKKPLKCSARNIDNAITYLNQTHLIGALDLQKAFEKCRGIADSGVETVLVHTGSAIPVLGEQDRSALLARLPENASYVGVGVGRQWHQPFMKAAAGRSGGYFTQINPDEEVHWRAFELSSLLNTPRLLNVRVEDADGSGQPQRDTADSVFLNFADTIIQGEEVCAVMKIKADAPLPRSVRVSGLLSGHLWQQTLKVKRISQGAAYLPRSWARLQIDQLIAAGGVENRNEIIRLSKSMYVMSPFTSLLVLENEEMYTQHNIDRGRSDHWALYDCPEEIKVVSEPLPGQQANDLNRSGSAATDWRHSVRRLPELPVISLPEQGHAMDLPASEVLRLRQEVFQESQRLQRWQWQQPGELGWYRAFNDEVLPRSGVLTDRQAGSESLVRLGVPLVRLQGVEPRAMIRQLVELRPEESRIPVVVYDLADEVSDLEALTGSLGFRYEADADAIALPELLISRRYGNFDFFEFNDVAAENREFTPQVTFSMLARSPEFASQQTQEQNPWMHPGTDLSGFIALPKIMGDISLDRAGGARPVYHFFTQRGTRDFFDDYTTIPRFHDNGLTQFNRNLSRWSAPADVNEDGIGVPPGMLGIESAVADDRNGEGFDSGGFGFGAAPLGWGAQPLSWGEGQWSLNFGRGLPRMRSGKQQGSQGIKSSGTERRYFGDLMAHAPGLNTSTADILAIAETHADTKSPAAQSRSGTLDPAAARLIEKARGAGWERVTFPAADGQTPLLLFCEGAGRHAYRRVVSEGLQEEVFCDGETLTHVYEEIGLASERRFSRFHWRSIASLVPWLVPPAEELARQANVVIIRPNTVAIRPVAAASTAKDSTARKAGEIEKVKPVYETHLVFGDDGRLTERRLVHSLSQEVEWRTVFRADGTVQLRDRHDTIVSSVALKREPAEAPALKRNLDWLVVLPMPIRSSEFLLVRKANDGGSPDFSKYTQEELLSLMLADMAEGNGSRVVKIIRDNFFQKGDFRDGLYVLLSHFPSQLQWEEDVTGTDGRRRQVDLRPSPEGSALRQFLRQDISRQTRTDGLTGPEFSIAEASDGLVNTLAQAANLYDRWKSGAATKDRTTAQIKSELKAALRFVASCRTDAMGWTLLSAIQPQIEAADLSQLLAEAAARFETSPQLTSVARQERVRLLFRAGQDQKARQLYAQFLRNAVSRGELPPLVPELRNSFTRTGGGAAWSQLMTDIGTELTKAKRLRAALSLSVQLRDLGDTDVAGEILEQVLASVMFEQRPDVQLLAVEQLRHLADGRADQLLDTLLESGFLRDSARLWRYAAAVADDLGRKQTALNRLEQAMLIEYRNRSTVIDVRLLRANYSEVMKRFEETIDASATLETELPDDLSARIIRAADQWRSLEDDPTLCCHMAARLLAKMGQRQMSWSYLTTPLAGRSGESAGWRKLAEELTGQQQAVLADLAWTKAFEYERTNPEILLGHARVLQASGRSVESRKLLKQIIDSSWQPRFNPVIQEARTMLP